MTPKDVLERLKLNATAKTQTTLDVIYEICLEQKQRRLSDFSVATIARLGFKRGVPKAQSLRNKTGEKYRALLKAFEEDSSSSNAGAEVGRDDWIEEIPHPKHRLLARIQQTELEAAQRKLREFVPPGTRIEVKDYHNHTLEEDAVLLKVERRALEYLISESFLRTWNFHVSKEGEFFDGNGKLVLKAGTVAAIKKALANL